MQCGNLGWTLAQEEVLREKLVKSKERPGVQFMGKCQGQLLRLDKSTLVMEDVDSGGHWVDEGHRGSLWNIFAVSLYI